MRAGSLFIDTNYDDETTNGQERGTFNEEEKIDMVIENSELDRQSIGGST
jgi:hypothetical protein